MIFKTYWFVNRVFVILGRQAWNAFTPFRSVLNFWKRTFDLCQDLTLVICLMRVFLRSPFLTDVGRFSNAVSPEENLENQRRMVLSYQIPSLKAR